MKGRSIPRSTEQSKFKEQNISLAGDNSKLKREVYKYQKLSTKLWLQHVKDRVDIRKIWKNGWKEGYHTRGEDNQLPMTASPLTPKMRTNVRIEEKLEILSSSSIFKQKRSIRELLAELQISEKDPQK